MECQSVVRLIIADETADFLIKHRHLGSGDLPNVE
jgi:hypothetical protein